MAPVTKSEMRRVFGYIGGKKGGKSRSPAKIAAVRENGKKGGRPKRPQMELKLPT